MDVFTHGIFVTNSQINKYLEPFSKKGLYCIGLLTILNKILKNQNDKLNTDGDIEF